MIFEYFINSFYNNNYKRSKKYNKLGIALDL